MLFLTYSDEKAQPADSAGGMRPCHEATASGHTRKPLQGGFGSPYLLGVEGKRRFADIDCAAHGEQILCRIAPDRKGERGPPWALIGVHDRRRRRFPALRDYRDLAIVQPHHAAGRIKAELLDEIRGEMGVHALAIIDE